ncbi:uncharacterized protein [Asterias amurensis]|uniref:uncharacterized protein isoform X2 n=1 Tax=Asterias amurensis TaxID=7602 RepID=UPI003AB164BA
MKRATGALVAAVFCCLLTGCFCQDPTDIYHGCYFDGVDRALQDLITCSDGMGVCQKSCGDEQTYCEGETGMTVDFCRTLCRSRNLQYYALQAGSQCFCGGALADPFQYTEYTADQVNCSYPCSGDASQTCGGDFKMQVYEFNEPVPGADCFHPGFVPNSFISDNLSPTVGEKVTYLCEPGHMIVGEPQLTCQTMRAWSPDILPTCNYTGIFPESTTQPPSEQPETTTPASTTLNEVSPTTLPLVTITDFLPYIIGGSATLLFILVICMVAIFTCNSRKRSGNARQNIRLKPESNPVTFINAGFHVENEEAVSKPGMPDILRASGNLPLSPDHSFIANQYPQNSRVSTFAEEGVYQNGVVTDSSDAPQSHYANLDDEESPRDSLPDPIYSNMEGAAAMPNSEPEAYVSQDYGNGYATTDRPNSKRISSSSTDPASVYATGNRRAKKNGTGTKDLTGWSRPSSLYQRTVLNESSDEDNTAFDPEQLNNALYAEVDKSRQSSRETLNTTSEDGNSFFGDPSKTSATRL